MATNLKNKIDDLPDLQDQLPDLNNELPDLPKEEEKSTAEKIKGYLGKAAKGVLDVFDYPYSNVAAPAIAYGLTKYTGKPVYKEGEYKGIGVNVDAPRPTEMLERVGLGIPEGYHLSDVFPQIKRGSALDITTSSLPKAALDIAADPLTYISGPLSSAAKAARTQAGVLPTLTKAANVVVNPAEEFLRYRANSLYKKAFEDVDRFAVQNNKKLLPSTLLKESKFSGDMTQAVEKIRDLNDEAGLRIGKIYDQASEAGAKVNLLESLKPAMEFASELRKKLTPEASQLAQQIDDRVLYMWEKSGGIAPIKDVHETKSFINQLITSSGFTEGTDHTLTTKARKALSSDLSSAEKEAVKNIDKDLYKDLLDANKIYSSTDLDIRNKMEQISNKVSERRPLLQPTQVDMMLLGGALAEGAIDSGINGAKYPLGALLLKKLGTAFSSTQGRTQRASLYQGLQQNRLGLLQPTLNKAAREGYWSLMNKKGEEE